MSATTDSDLNSAADIGLNLNLWAYINPVIVPLVFSSFSRSSFLRLLSLLLRLPSLPIATSHHHAMPSPPRWRVPCATAVLVSFRYHPHQVLALPSTTSIDVHDDGDLRTMLNQRTPRYSEPFGHHATNSEFGRTTCLWSTTLRPDHCHRVGCRFKPRSWWARTHDTRTRAVGPWSAAQGELWLCRRCSCIPGKIASPLQEILAARGPSTDLNKKTIQELTTKIEEQQGQRRR